MTQSRRMSRWSYALPKTSSSVCGVLDMAPALSPPCPSARRRRAASPFDASRLFISTCFPSLIGELLLDLLDAPEPGVEATGLEQLGVRARLHHPALVEDDDLIGLLGDAQSVRHDERAAPRDGGAERVEDLRLLARIDGGENVVEHKDGRLGHEGAGEGDTLALPAGQGEAALADHRLPALGEALDLRAQSRRFHGRAESHLGRHLVAEGDVVTDGA